MLIEMKAMAEKYLIRQVCQASGRYCAPGTYRICKLRITRYGIKCNTYNGIYIIDSGGYLRVVKGKDKAYTPASEEILRNRQTLVKPLVDSYFGVGKHSWHIIATRKGAGSSAMLYSTAETAKF